MYRFWGQWGDNVLLVVRLIGWCYWSSIKVPGRLPYQSLEEREPSRSRIDSSSGMGRDCASFWVNFSRARASSLFPQLLI
jgi:hypothetical protein